MTKPVPWRINSFKQLGLTDPLLPTKTFKATLDFILSLEFDTSVYPLALLMSGPPRCIFIPTPVLLRRMLMAVVAYGGEESFFSRFGMGE